jgi:UDP-glucose 4-epimerase
MHAVDDIVSANLALLETDAADGGTMNVGSTGNITVEELAASVIEVTGSELDPVYTRARKGESRHTHAEVEKACDLIG